MTEQLHFHFSLSCIGEGISNPLQCSCLENPRDGGACWAAVYGVAQSWTRLKRLSSSSSRTPSHRQMLLNIFISIDVSISSHLTIHHSVDSFPVFTKAICTRLQWILVTKLMDHSSDLTLLTHLYAFDIADPFLLYEVLLPLVPII